MINSSQFSLTTSNVQFEKFNEIKFRNPNQKEKETFKKKTLNEQARKKIKTRVPRTLNREKNRRGLDHRDKPLFS